MRRSFCLIFIVFQLIWLNVIVPGHRRGIVQMAVLKSAEPDSAPACSMCCGESHDKQAPKLPTATCAICDFAAHLMLPPVFDFTHSLHSYLGIVPDNLRDDLIAREVLVPFNGRGPPTLV